MRKVWVAEGVDCAWLLRVPRRQSPEVRTCFQKCGLVTEGAHVVAKGVWMCGCVGFNAEDVWVA